MKLNKILYSCVTIKVVGSLDIDINNIVFDSREVSDNDLFVAISGTVVDGSKFVLKAIELGAKAILCNKLPNELLDNITYIQVSDTQLALAHISKNFYGNPSSKLRLVGITGTNGKTSTATLLYNLFTSLGYRCGLVSTINNIICGNSTPSTHTTPDAITLNKLFCEMIEMGCEFCFMEVSSHAISQHRIDGLEFDVALFTNITHDHLDYHKTFDSYIATKKRLFDTLSPTSVAIYNSDDRNGKIMVQNSKSKKKSFSLRSASDYCCKIVEGHLNGTLIEIDKQELWIKFIGRFNAYNILGIYAVAIELGLDKNELLSGLSLLEPISGRFETIGLSNDSMAVVDYAHTPDALDNVMTTISDINASGGKIITVVGCGGDRDKTKRPIMAKIAVKNSDFTIFTSDNPRSESAQSIIDDMLCGVSEFNKTKYITILSRREAIKMGVMMATQVPKSILMVAGKGHETYQEVDSVRTHFDDKEEILNNI